MTREDIEQRIKSVPLIKLLAALNLVEGKSLEETMKEVQKNMQEFYTR